MKIWDELLSREVEDKEKYKRIFSDLVREVQKNPKQYIKEDVIEKEDYYLVMEENRAESCFVHVVPKELFMFFNEMRKKVKGILGFSVLVGNVNGKEVRVSCFGVDCSSLGKSLIKNDNKDT